MTTPTEPQRPALLRLPLELRRMIYNHVLRSTFRKRPDQRHAFQAIYHQQTLWTDHPLPFLLVHRQIHQELSSLLSPIPVFIRITSQGLSFDLLGLASATAQGFHHHRDSSLLPSLIVKIWPPHPERPFEILQIWHHVLRLRDILQKSPRIQTLTLHFTDKKGFKWCRNRNPKHGNILLRVCRRIVGEEEDSTSQPKNPLPGSDMETLIPLFATLTNVQSARIKCPASFYEDPSRLAFCHKIELIMQGLHPPSPYPSELEQYNHTAISSFLTLHPHRVTL
ncbi:MAG: hypothetical protein L6R40_003996 [Gallowayella cf. fulva]|nr:MAG: hypothetical protein L6R40_003996 [Xanthomendoza cf. fulva]